MGDTHYLKLNAAQLDHALASAQSVSNQNLLDNWCFLNPVNQRGKSEYNEAGYGIDRWNLKDNKISVAIEPDGIAISATAATQMNQWVGYAYEYLAGKTVTISALADGSLFTASATIPETVPSSYTTILSTQIKTGFSFLLGYSTTKPGLTCVWNFTSAAYAKVIAGKIEPGHQQTLAHLENGVWVLNEIPNYAEELAKCQRYYQLFSSADKRPSDKRDFRPELRTNATSANTGTIVIDGVTYYYADANL